MKINTVDPNPPVRVDIEKGGAHIMLRPASGDILENIKKETHTRKFKNVRGVVHEYFDIDEDRYDYLLWKYCLTGWAGITDESGKEIEYSPEIAADLIRESPFFSEIISDALDDVKRVISERAMASAKN